MQKDVNGATLSYALLERLESESLRATESEALLKQTRKMSLDLGGPEKSDQEKSDHKKSGKASRQAALKLLEFISA